MKTSHPFILVVFAALLVGCGEGEYASFEAGSVDQLPECMAEQFPFEPTFLAAKTRNDRTGLYLQTARDTNSFHDAVVIQVYEPDDIADENPVELSAGSNPTGIARGKMAFFSSCPYAHDTLEIGGDVHFESFGQQAGSVITAELVDGYALDARSGEVVIEELSGSWSFEVRERPPYDDFYAVPERP